MKNLEAASNCHTTAAVIDISQESAPDYIVFLHQKCAQQLYLYHFDQLSLALFVTPQCCVEFVAQATNVFVIKMGIAHHHLQLPVAQNLGNLSQRNASHGQM